MPAESNNRPPPHRFDMSLRLLSDRIPMKPILQQLGVEPTHLHEVGMPMATEGPLAGRLARRYYAGIGASRTDRDSDVAEWCSQIIAKVASAQTLIGHLADKEIEASLWIAIFETGLTPYPEIPADIVKRAEQLRLSIFFESYVGDSGNLPEKFWLLDMRPEA
jgi:hypothetical protein